jgi:hypothetical protein
MHLCRLVVATLAVLFAVHPEGHAQTSDEAKNLIGLQEAIAKAVETGDAAAWEKLAADDYQFITPTGVVMGRAERLALVKKGPVPGFGITDASVRIYGDVAVVSGIQGPKRNVRFSAVWVKRAGTWRAVLNHATPIQKP